MITDNPTTAIVQIIMHFTISFLALFFLPAFAQTFIPEAGTFIDTNVKGRRRSIAVVVAYSGTKIMGAYVDLFENRLHGLSSTEESMGNYDIHLARYFVNLEPKVMDMIGATKRDDIPAMSPQGLEALKMRMKGE